MIIKRATEAGEFFQIHQLNYKTFVEEIPQHQQNTEKILVDKFHNKNQYIVAKRNDKLIGMVCYNLQRPFSLDEKISNLNNYLPEFTNLAEIRLLSVIPEERNTKVVYRLFKYVATEFNRLKIDTAIISGTTRQLRLYTHLGFKPFGSLVGKPGALYQPMYVTIKKVSYDFKNS
ncbi:MAG: GNAT family N-acetyltransferase [Segetibacter sp.]|nr:GNAT family N-acetyltransferase [Segetibacter sp.]